MSILRHLGKYQIHSNHFSSSHHLNDISTKLMMFGKLPEIQAIGIVCPFTPGHADPECSRHRYIVDTFSKDPFFQKQVAVSELFAADFLFLRCQSSVSSQEKW